MQEKPEQEVMTVSEVAEFLQLAERTVLRMAQRGEIPAAKIASQWRFMRSMVREWLLARTHSAEAAAVKPAPAVESQRLVELFRPELIRTDIQPGPKSSILAQLVEPVRQSGFARDSSQLLDALIRREAMMTTGVGESLAIPHPRQPLEGMFPVPAVALGICGDGADFDAIDGLPVRVFFLICATREDVHLQLMARVFWLARQPDALDQLASAEAPEQIQRILSDIDARAGAGLTFDRSGR